MSEKTEQPIEEVENYPFFFYDKGRWAEKCAKNDNGRVCGRGHTLYKQALTRAFQGRV